MQKYVASMSASALLMPFRSDYPYAHLYIVYLN